MRKRLTQSKLEKAVKAIAAICGAAQVVIEPDGTIRILPVASSESPVHYNGPINL
jgi:hypothetical protein